ncbi:MAG: secretion protein HlyD [Sphingomonas bacterium]|nr:efflux RND transporter periplasmic adaptor subunit [Sphingomonas bacterium]MDB5690834.1 secretion protein HlyD [Sphingomonas bacterium]
MDQMTSQAELDNFLGVQPPSRKGRLIKYGLIALGLMLLALVLYRGFFSGAPAVRYASEPLRRDNLTVTVAATGNLAPTNQIAVGSEISGLVQAVYAQANDRVVKGQVLARVDTARLEDAIVRSRAALDAAQASVSQARATARQSQANLRRLLEVFRLSGGKVPSQTELDTGRADAARAAAGIASAEAGVAQARAQLNSDQTNLSRATIRSPVNGVVLSREVEEGQTIQGSFSAPTLFTIAEDLSAMKLEVKVDEADVGQVASGQRASFSVDAFPGRRFPATIQRVNVGSSISSAATGSSSTSTATASTNTVVSYTAVLQVANPELILRPGMTATADIVVAERRAVFLVPNAALRYTPSSGQGAGRGGGGLMTQMGPPMRGRGGGGEKTAKIERGARRQIYVVGPDGTPQPVSVTVGSSNGSQTEVSGADLRAGMAVITGSLAAPAA